jgi:hypothetical protein
MATVTPEALQTDFAAALRAPAGDAAPAAFPAGAARRFRIYRNNARMALIEALAANYPVVRKIVGEPAFGTLAQAYAADRPSRARTLNFYGADFAHFVAGYAPLRDLSYLADVARTERAVLEARHAADAAPLDPAMVAALATARLVAHPAARLVWSDYPVADIWNAHTGDASGNDDLVFTTGAAAALIARPGLTVAVSALDAATAAFADALLRGADLATAHEQAIDVSADFDVMTAFRELLAAGIFHAVADDSAEG